MTTAKEELTTKRLEALMPAPVGQRYEIADTHVGGLRVRVGDAKIESTDRRRNGKAGHVSFVLLARFTPKANPTRRTLGTFPELSLGDARQKAIDWKTLIRRGIDPAEEAKQRRAEAEHRRLSRRTIGEVLDQYEADKLANLRRGKATRRALDGSCGLLADLRDREPNSISRSEIRAALRKRALTSPISANRQLAYAKAFFNWCVAEEIVSANPAQSIAKPSIERARDRHHSLDELQEIWRAAVELGYPFGHLVRLLMVLPMRREELAAMPIAEVDLGPEGATEGIWTLPAERTKRANALRVPLGPLARSIVSEAIRNEARPNKSPFVFSTTETTSVSGFAKAKRRLDRTIAANQAKAAEASGVDPVPMPHWTFHDLRTSFTTLACEELGVDAAVADRILNHVATATTSKIMRVYNKSELFEQRRLALCAWEDFVRNRVIGEESGKVVPIRAARV
ncbi:site-specific integrase [Sphingomonas humi]|uniref:Site-specific integrase n=1 Tax=Sphingomonas humi TaxID=335630 RepID=A0ABP7SCX3_9SPHN